MDPITKRKSDLRILAKQRRIELSEAYREAGGRRIAENLAALPEFSRAESVFIYVSCGTEVPTHSIIDQLMAKGVCVAVPKIIPGGEMVAVRFAAWADLRRAELGILAPVSSVPWPHDFDIVVTPGLAFTRRGYRLGYGAGYYDKWFATHASTFKIAIAYATQLVTDVPTDVFDVPVDCIVTESGVERCDSA